MAKVAYPAPAFSSPLPFNKDIPPWKTITPPARIQPPATQLPSGVQLINISAPDSNGVSYNRRETFNLAPQGLILNNTDNAYPMQAGGYTRCNPQLKATGPAHTIILHTTGPLPFTLKGYIEVEGPKTNVVIASPEGIYCEKFNFINIEKIRLTTGRPFIRRQGRAITYHITQGHIQVGKALKHKASSLNANHLDLELLARTVAINAKLSAKKITVITGHYQIPQTTSDAIIPFIQPIKQLESEHPTPTTAIDITSFSHIKAQQLHLKSTEDKVDIDNKGQLNTKKLILESEGNLTLRGSIYTQKGFFSAQKQLLQQDQLESTNTLTLESQYHLIHTGTATSKTLAITAPRLEVSGPLKAKNSLFLQGYQLDLKGELSSKRLLTAKAYLQLLATCNFQVGSTTQPNQPAGQLRLESEGELQSTGKHYSSGSISLQGSALYLNYSAFDAQNKLTLQATKSNIYLSRAITKSAFTTLEAPQTIYHRESHLQSAELRLKALNLMNTMGRIYSSGSIKTEFSSISQAPTLPGKTDTTLLNNIEGRIQADKALQLQAPNLKIDNTRGKLIAETLSCEILKLYNTKGCLRASTTLNLSLPTWKSSGLLKAKESVTLNLKKDYIHSEKVFSTPKIFIDTEGEIINASRLYSDQTIEIKAASFHNEPNALVNSNQVQLYLAGPVKNKGRIYSAHLKLAATHLYNVPSFPEISDDSILSPLSHTGSIASHKTLHMGVNNQIYNFPGSSVVSEGDMHVGGYISPEGEISGLTKQVYNYSGTFEAKGHLKIQAHAIQTNNAYFMTENRCTAKEERTEYQEKGSTKRYPKEKIRWGEGESGYQLLNLLEENRGIMTYTRYDYTFSQEETVVTESYPARIQAGKHLVLSGVITNEKSYLRAGDTLTGIPGLPYSLDNQGAMGERIYREKGYKRDAFLKWETWWKQLWNEPKCRYYRSPVNYDHTQTYEFNLPILPQHEITPPTLPANSSDILASLKEESPSPVHTLPPTHWLPTCSRFQIQFRNRAYLVRSDPEYQETHSLTTAPALSSDYLLKQKLQLIRTPKRLGDGAYEQYQVIEQIQALTQQRYLSGHSNDEVMFKALMDAAYTESQNLSLTPGTPLTVQQVSQLKEDIVWMVDQDITLADGERQTFLVPQVYLSAKSAISPSLDTLISAKRIMIKGDFLKNVGSTFFSQEGTHLAAREVTNQSGQLKTYGPLQLKTTKNLHSVGGQFKGGDVTFEIDETLFLKSQTRLNKSIDGHYTVLDQIAKIEAANLKLKVGNKIEWAATKIEVKKKACITATNHINVGAVTVSHSKQVKADQYKKTYQQIADVSSELQAKDLVLNAKDITIAGSQLIANAQLKIDAQNNIQFKPTYHKTTLEQLDERDDPLFTSSKVQDKSHANIALSSTLAAPHVKLTTGGDLNGEGLILAGGDIAINTNGELTLQAAPSHFTLSEHQSTETNGFSLGSTLNLGTKSSKTDTTQSQTVYSPNQINTQKLQINAQKNLLLSGYEIKATHKLELSGKQVQIEEVMNETKATATQESTQFGFSAGLTGGVLSIGNTVLQNREDASQAQSNALAMVKNAQALYTVGSSVLSKNERRTQEVSCKDIYESAKAGNLKGAVEATGIKAYVAVGIKDQSETTEQIKRNAQTSTLQAKEMTINAQVLDISGTHLKSDTINLDAGDIKIRQAVDTTALNSKAKHDQLTFGIRTGGKKINQAFVEIQESDQTHNQTTHKGAQSVLEAQTALKIKSKNNVYLEGINAKSEHIDINAEGALTIKSIQDKKDAVTESNSTYINVGVPATALPPANPANTPSINFSYQNQKIATHTASVEEQTILEAGKGGFSLKAGKITHLVGAHIASATHANLIESERLQCEKIDNNSSHQDRDTGLHFNTDLDTRSTCVQNATSNLAWIGGKPKTQSTITESTLTNTQLKLKSNHSPTFFSNKPIHQPADTNTQEKAEEKKLGEAIGQLGMKMAGDAMDQFEKKYPKMRHKELVRVGLHAVPAVLSAKAQKTSTLGALAGVAAGNAVTYNWKRNPKANKNEAAISDLTCNAAAGLAGGIAGGIFGGWEGVESGASQALMADAWNRQLHLEEAKILAEVEKSLSEEGAQKLKEAIAYLIKPSKSVKEDDLKKAQFEEMERKGKNHAPELAALKTLKKYKLLKYTLYDTLSDWLLRNDEKAQKTVRNIKYTTSLSFFAIGVHSMPMYAKGLFFPLLHATGTSLSAFTCIDLFATGDNKPQQITEGQRVLNSFNPNTHPGKRNRPLELACEGLEPLLFPVILKGAQQGIKLWPQGAIFGVNGWVNVKLLGKQPLYEINTNIKINWAKNFYGIKLQGLDCEDYLEIAQPGIRRLQPNFKTYDFYNQFTQHAISAKTMNLQTNAKLNNPKQIWYSLKKNIDETVQFTEWGANPQLSADAIKSREIFLVIRGTPTPTQCEQLQAAKEYAESQGTRLNITMTL